MQHPEPRDPRRSRGSVAPPETHAAPGPGNGDRAGAAAADRPRWWPWIALTLAAAVVAAAVLRALTGPVYLVPSGSMEPLLLPGDRVRVAPPTDGAAPARGDVVVFDGAGSLAPYRSQTSLTRGLDDVAAWWGLGGRRDAYVKRVLALPGDTLECCAADGRLVREGVRLDEPYLGRPVTPQDPASAVSFQFEVPEGRMVVLGDNRANSRDSRALLGEPGGGMIPLDHVVGRVEDVVWPPDRRGDVR